MKTLREWRAERLLGVKALAAKAGVSNKTIVQIEHGAQVPSFRTIRRLSEALGVEPREVTEFAAAIEAAGKCLAAA
jgi:transcriptional regulator with XRE-family HTH domain